MSSLEDTIEETFLKNEAFRATNADELKDQLARLKAEAASIMAKLAVLNIQKDPVAEFRQEITEVKRKFPWLLTSYGRASADSVNVTTDRLRMMYQDYSRKDEYGNDGYFYAGMPGPVFTTVLGVSSVTFQRKLSCLETVDTPDLKRLVTEKLAHPHAHHCDRLGVDATKFSDICYGSNKFHPRFGGAPITSPIGLVNCLHGLGIWLSTCNVSDTYDYASVDQWVFTSTPKRESWDLAMSICEQLLPGLNKQLQTGKASMVEIPFRPSDLPHSFDSLCGAMPTGDLSLIDTLIFRDALIAWVLAYHMSFHTLSLNSRNMKDQVLYDLRIAPVILKDGVYGSSFPYKDTTTWRQQVNAPKALRKRHSNLPPYIETNL